MMIIFDNTHQEKQWKVACVCLSMVLVLCAYSRLYEIGFVRADDRWMILHNVLVRNFSFTTDYFIELFSSLNSIQYSPLNTLYYALIYQVNAYDPYYFHLFSFLTHIVNTYLVYLLVRRVMLAFSLENAMFIAWAAAVFWMISPMNTETVVWISASKITMSAMFTFLCMLSFISGVTSGRKWPLVWVPIYLVLGFLFKEQVVVVPAMLLVFWCCYRKHKGEGWLDRKWAMYLGFLLLLALVMGLMTLKINKADVRDLSSYPFHQRFFLSFYCLFFYVFNLILPIGLHYHYTYPMPAGQPLPWLYYLFFLFFLPVAAGGINFVRRNKLHPFYAFCGLAFIIHLGICLQIVPMTRPAVMADRYMYIPSVFIFAACLNFLINHLLAGKNTRTLTYWAVGAGIYLIILIAYSNRLIHNWHKINFQ